MPTDRVDDPPALKEFPDEQLRINEAFAPRELENRTDEEREVFAEPVAGRTRPSEDFDRAFRAKRVQNRSGATR